ncbi:hypothetical protein V6N13_140360 [Hibiscus sabdariffa]
MEVSNISCSFVQAMGRTSSFNYSGDKPRSKEQHWSDKTTIFGSHVRMLPLPTTLSTQQPAVLTSKIKILDLSTWNSVSPP